MKTYEIIAKNLEDADYNPIPQSLRSKTMPSGRSMAHVVAALAEEIDKLKEQVVYLTQKGQDE